MSLILLIVAILCFLLAVFGVGTVGVVQLVPLGLAFFAASFLPLGGSIWQRNP